MAKQNPDLLLLKLGDDSDPIVYSTLCGLNTRNFTIDGETVDVTTVDCTGSGDKLFRQMIAGVSQCSFSGSGFFENKAQTTILVDAKLSGTAILPFQVVVPGLGTFTGQFIIGSLGVAGTVNGGAVTMEVALSSTGAVVFAAET